MDAAHRVVRATLEEAHRTFAENTHGLSLEEALYAAGLVTAFGPVG